MLLNQIENTPVTNVCRFIFIDSKTQSFLNMYDSEFISRTLAIAIDFLFPASTIKDFWKERDRYPYKDIISLFKDVLYEEVNEIFEFIRHTKLTLTRVLDVQYIGNVILLSVNVDQL